MEQIKINLADFEPTLTGYTFQWLRGNGDEEIYGMVNDPQHNLVYAQCGWFRTTDPKEAARIAASNLAAAL